MKNLRLTFLLLLAINLIYGLSGLVGSDDTEAVRSLPAARIPDTTGRQGAELLLAEDLRSREVGGSGTQAEADVTEPAGTGLQPGREHASDVAGDVDASAESGPQCIKVGPLESDEIAEQVLANLARFVAEGYVETEDVAGEDAFLVYVLPRSSRTEAAQVAERFTDIGMQANVIDEEGPLNNGVSLGFYRDHEGAKQAAAGLSEIGYPLKVRHTMRFRAAPFVHGLLRGESLPEEGVGSVSEAVRIVDETATIAMISCDTVASADKLD